MAITAHVLWALRSMPLPGIQLHRHSFWFGIHLEHFVWTVAPAMSSSLRHLRICQCSQRLAVEIVKTIAKSMGGSEPCRWCNVVGLRELLIQRPRNRATNPWRASLWRLWAVFCSQLAPRQNSLYLRKLGTHGPAPHRGCQARLGTHGPALCLCTLSLSHTHTCHMCEQARESTYARAHTHT